MNHFIENATVIYTDAKGRKIDTFVIFDTDPSTGLTHINHENLKVSADKLTLHNRTVGKYHLPINDAFSFEMLKKLREKYAYLDSQPKQVINSAPVTKMYPFAKAS